MGDEIDWSEIPVDVTHYCKAQNLWYRRHPSGEWQYKEPFGRFDWMQSIMTGNHVESLIARPVEHADKKCRVITHSPSQVISVEKLMREREKLRTKVNLQDVLIEGQVSRINDLIANNKALREKQPHGLAAEPGYERLVAVLKAAHDQAAMGKGADRHANGLPFHKQRMQQISVLLDSPHGMAYQVAKKVAEGLDLPTHERQVAELYGAINYIAGIVIFLEDKLAGDQP